MRKPRPQHWEQERGQHERWAQERAVTNLGALESGGVGDHLLVRGLCKLVRQGVEKAHTSVTYMY